jgi:hypothetical protein
VVFVQRENQATRRARRSCDPTPRVNLPVLEPAPPCIRSSGFPQPLRSTKLTRVKDILSDMQTALPEAASGEE